VDVQYKIDKLIEMSLCWHRLRKTRVYRNCVVARLSLGRARVKSSVMEDVQKCVLSKLVTE
jgi:hypothetical protein